MSYNKVVVSALLACDPSRKPEQKASDEEFCLRFNRFSRILVPVSSNPLEPGCGSRNIVRRRHRPQRRRRGERQYIRDRDGNEPGPELHNRSIGQLHFSALPIGDYNVTITTPGFATITNKGVTVAVGKSTKLNVTLRIATTNETISVQAQVEVLNTSNAETGGLFTPAQVTSFRWAAEISSIS